MDECPYCHKLYDPKAPGKFGYRANACQREECVAARATAMSRRKERALSPTNESALEADFVLGFPAGGRTL